MTWIDEYFKWALLIAWPASLGFVVLYGVTAPWYKTFIGRALEGKSTSIFVLLTLSDLYALLGQNYVGRDTLKFIGATMLVVFIWLQFVALIKIKLEQLRDRRDPSIADRDVRHDV